MTSPASAPEEHQPEHRTSLANRYGRPKRRLSRRGVITLAVAGVLALVLVVLYLSQNSESSYEPKNVSYDVVDSRHTDVTVAVEMQREDTITCGIEVLAEDHAVVGYTEKTFSGKQGQKTAGNRVVVQRKVPVRTTFRGVTGQTSICWSH